MTKVEKKAKEDALNLLKKANIILSDKEKNQLEFCDYGLDNFEKVGTMILIYVNTSRVCAKEIILMPYQICPEHIHPQLGDYPGKEETFRCRYGEVYLYVPGEKVENPRARIPNGKEDVYTVWHEIVLKPGDQYTMKEKTLHWFQAGPEGAVVSEFSTPSFDEADIFTDPEIKRVGKFN